MSTHILAGVTLITEECCRCHCIFAIPLDMQQRLIKSRELFYCPAGHQQHFTGETEETKLRRELERKQRELEMQEANAARMKKERDQVAKAHSRMRRRVFNGVCPCCNRTFQNLMQHMQTKHAGEFNLGTLREAFGMTQTALAKEIGVYQMQVSRYERGLDVPAYARTAIEAWVDRQAEAAKA